MKYKTASGELGEYSVDEERLVRRALRRGTSSATLMAQARAVQVLMDLGTPVPVDKIRIELEWIARDLLGTYQSGQAAQKATRLLSVLNGDPADEQWPHPRPDEPVPAGPDQATWPYLTAELYELLGGEIMDAGVHAGGWRDQPDGGRDRVIRRPTFGERDRARARVEGAPPWSRSKSIERLRAGMVAGAVDEGGEDDAAAEPPPVDDE